MKKANRKLRKLLSLILVVVVLFTCTSFAAFADTPDTPDMPPHLREMVESADISPAASAYISSYSAGISKDSSGNIKVTFSIGGTGSMTDIGVTDIYLYQNDLEGHHSTAATYHCTDPEYSYMMAHGRLGWMSDVTYEPDAGYEYHAYVFFKAGNSSGYDTRTVHTNYLTA